ncbi:MAG: MerR family transcriptional regulator [Longimicrobiales bacterium]
MAELWQVSDVARVAHVTVRTLHHYEAIGLLRPGARSPAGYRLYSQADLERLHQILLLRELGFGLEAIGRLLDEPAIDRAAALRAQRESLLAKLKQTEAVIRAVDRMIEAIETGGEMDHTEMFEGLGQADHAEHAEEARERWGQTDAYKESMRRARRYSKDEWATIGQQREALEADLAALLAAGGDPEAAPAMELAEGLRLHIDQWFYPCSYRMHACLADMYEADARFTAHYETRAVGLAGFVAAAIRANAMRAWDEGKT